MAKNSEKRAQSRKERLAARAEAERIAAEQAKRERTIQTAIGVAVVVVLVAVIGTVGYFVGRNMWESSVPTSQRADSLYSKVEAVKNKPKNATKDGGFLLSAKGLNKQISNVPTIDEYMDFICPACGTMNRTTHATIESMVSAGQINFVAHPAAFLNASSTDRYSTRSAAFVAYVLDNEPDKGMALIAKLFSTDTQPGEASAYKSVSNADLIKIAQSVGVSDKVAQAAAQGKYEKWIDAISAWDPYREELWNVTGSYKGTMTTPTILINKNYWDYNTLTAKYNTDYVSLLLESIGLTKADVGNSSAKPSIGSGTPRDISNDATSKSSGSKSESDSEDATTSSR
ncbi:DsbA family protein [Alloscardovia venturai]|uniref:DsbA family protein n=1 Tax=Alloscardovia venturai TaxID=1769421 RepID=A0ABW2Y666_9BIFI